MFFALIGVLLAADPPTSPLSFNQQIRPILSAKCFRCHGPDQQEGGLRLDIASSATSKLESGKHAIIPNNPGQSELLRRTQASDDDVRMPPPEAGQRLAPEQIALLETWIRDGAPYETHWAFVLPKAPPLPLLKNPWPRGPIDTLILSSWINQKIEPALEAPSFRLLRRTSLDLTGLPPTLAEQEAWNGDAIRADRFERLVDRLLASPSFGIKQSASWLDLARYADTDGYALDIDRSIWPYRDWVVDAMNANVPFDQFSIEQLAGDLLPDASESQKIATGLHRNTRISTEAGSDPEEYRMEAVMDRINTTATIWLAMTVGCAQCHSHKFDPIAQEDYYRLLAFFNQGEPETKRNEAGVITNISPRLQFHTSAQLVERDRVTSQIASASSEEERRRLQRELEQIQPVQTLIMKDQLARRPTFLFLRGSFLTPGKQVDAGLPIFIANNQPSSLPPSRLELARWLVSPQNPLAARAHINRLWQQFFGFTFVDTLDDLGSQSPPVQHQDLLDYLAIEFMESGWNVKELIRDIVTSSLYCQDSDVSPGTPSGPHWNRARRIRLPAESLRDQAFAIGEILSSTMGGKPIQAPRMAANDRDNPYRRSIYFHWKRGLLENTLLSFDAPNRDVCTARREPTTSPIQSLDLFNNRHFTDAARGVAEQLTLLPKDARVERTDLAFRLVLARTPNDAERNHVLDYFNQQRANFEKDPSTIGLILNGGTVHRRDLTLSADDAAWVMIASALLSLDETLSRE